MNSIFNCNSIKNKNFNVLLPLLGFVFLLTIGCASEERDRPDVVKDKSGNTENTTQPSNTPSADLSTKDNATGGDGGDVQHYICPNECEGSGGDSQGNCPVCGTEYVHNQEFHNQGNQNQNQQSQNQMNVEGGDQLQDLQKQQQASTPAQNEDGEYHYICSAGCSGGSGSQGTCSECGAELTHNTAYHD